MAIIFDRTHFVLVAFPLLILASDLYSIFLNPPPSPPHPHHHHQHQHHHPPPQSAAVSSSSSKLLEFSPRSGAVDAVSLGGKFHISFCTSCSYKKSAIQTRDILLSLFPGTEVVFSNYPPPLIKRLLSKLVPVIQFGGIALIAGGEHIFPRLGYVSPPSWYFTIRQNRFGAVASFWLLGNALQNVLQGTGAFEVYFDGDLIFSKLKENSFPGEFELRERINKAMEQKL